MEDDSYDVEGRRHAKQASREDDARHLAEAEIAQTPTRAVNCLFSQLDPSRARILRRRVGVGEP